MNRIGVDNGGDLPTLAVLFALASSLHAQQSTSFVYDPAGRRMEKSSAGIRTSTFMGGAYETTSGGGNTKYIHGPGGLVASITTGGPALPPAPTTYPSLQGSTIAGLPQGIRYSHSDHLGSASVLTDGNGTEVARNLYRPYGELIRSNSTGQDAERHKFTGQEQDDETSLQYYVARYRDPLTTLWMTADRVVPSEDILGYNRFAYVRGNPLKYSDPTGHEPNSDLKLADNSFSSLDYELSTASHAVEYVDAVLNMSMMLKSTISLELLTTLQAASAYSTETRNILFTVLRNNRVSEMFDAFSMFDRGLVEVNRAGSRAIGFGRAMEKIHHLGVALSGLHLGIYAARWATGGHLGPMDHVHAVASGMEVGGYFLGGVGGAALGAAGAGLGTGLALGTGANWAVEKTFGTSFGDLLAINAHGASTGYLGAMDLGILRQQAEREQQALIMELNSLHGDPKERYRVLGPTYNFKTGRFE